MEMRLRIKVPAGPLADYLTALPEGKSKAQSVVKLAEEALRYREGDRPMLAEVSRLALAMEALTAALPQDREAAATVQGTDADPRLSNLMDSDWEEER